MKLPNGVSVILLVALYGALEAVAAQLSLEAGWIPAAATALIAGAAKALQVYMETRKDEARWARPVSTEEASAVKRFWLN